MATEQIAISHIRAIPRRNLRPGWTTSACILASDVIALSIVYWMAVLGRYATDPRMQPPYYVRLFPVIGLFIAVFFVHDLYPGLLLHPAEEIRRVFRCIAIASLAIGCLTFLSDGFGAYSRSVFLIILAFAAPFVLLMRHVSRLLFSSRPWWGVPAIVLGTESAARHIMRTFEDNNVGLRISGVLTNVYPDSWPTDLPPLWGAIERAPEIARRGLSQYAIIAMPHSDSDELRHIVQEHCIGFRHVLLMPDLPEICGLHTAACQVGGRLALEVPQRLFDRHAALMKRLFDMLSSGMLLLFLFPLLSVVALLIRLTSPGPIFFGHGRYGRNGHIFKAWKFRTMVTNGDEVLRKHLESHPAARDEWQRDQKLKDDPRVTSIGKWLRRCSVDELPQLWNVFTGEMSLVGPRPIVKSEIDRYGDAYSLYQRVIPGITGLWQVSGRNNTSYAERIAFDEYYVRNWSIWLDLYILARTVRTVLTGDGAY